ncbi:TPA: hypothetical protein ACIXX9_005491, partial [Escherichia coli]
DRASHRVGFKANPHTGLALASVPIRFVEINRFCCAVDISNILHLVPNHNEGSGKIQTLR